MVVGCPEEKTMKYYLDSCTIISIFEDGDRKGAEKLKSVTHSDVKIPSMVKAEFLTGVYNNRKAEYKIDKAIKILAPYEIIPFDSDAAVTYARIRTDLEKKGNIIGPNDLVIAATVLSRGGILVTGNTKEFKRVEGLHVEDWCG